MRRFIFASHHYLAYGLKDTVDFLTNKAKTIYDINAYAEDKEQNLESNGFAGGKCVSEILSLYQ